MFLIKCGECGREQEWKTGVEVGVAAIQFASYECICDCGHVVMEREEMLLECAVEE